MADLLAFVSSWFSDLVGWIVGDSLTPDHDFSLARWALRPATAIMALVVALELIFPRDRRPWNRQHLLTFSHFVLASKVSIFVFITAPALQWVWVRFHLPSLHLDEQLPLWLYMPITLLVISFIDYWSHRLLHRIPLLWHVHKIHHAAKELTWASTFQEHFVMTITSAPMLTVATLLLGTHLVPPWGAVFILVNYLQHANVDLKFGKLNYFFALPEVHRYHHSTNPRFYDTNFSGGFTLWDHVYGTFYYNPLDPATEFGLDDDVPTNWIGQQVRPLVWMWNDVRRRGVVKALTGKIE